ncbi:hypothetical protein H6F94_21295 [Leptolyngbya sp. FACHB-261]|nr:hypothetical protein [Leptolyngbya sp. FACHB-261]
MFYLPDPPYFLLVAALVAGLASGKAFEATLRAGIQEWARSKSSRSLANLRSIRLLLPYIGINLGIVGFLICGLEIFGFTFTLACAVAIPLTILIALLVWYQLNVLLTQLEQGGSRALDLDMLEP